MFVFQDTISYSIISQQSSPFSTNTLYFYIDQISGNIWLRESLLSTSFSQFVVSFDWIRYLNRNVKQNSKTLFLVAWTRSLCTNNWIFFPSYNCEPVTMDSPRSVPTAQPSSLSTGTSSLQCLSTPRTSRELRRTGLWAAMSSLSPPLTRTWSAPSSTRWFSPDPPTSLWIPPLGWSH